MLVTFTCDAYENITLFGDVAKQLLTMMGQSGTVPGAILADDVTAALTRLKLAIHQIKHIKPAPKPDDDEEPDVSLAHRALPLIALLQAAEKHQCNVMWLC